MDVYSHLFDIPLARGNSHCSVREPLLRVQVLRSRPVRRAQGAGYLHELLAEGTKEASPGGRRGSTRQDGIRMRNDNAMCRDSVRRGKKMSMDGVEEARIVIIVIDIQANTKGQRSEREKKSPSLLKLFFFPFFFFFFFRLLYLTSQHQHHHHHRHRPTTD